MPGRVTSSVSGPAAACAPARGGASAGMPSAALPKPQAEARRQQEPACGVGGEQQGQEHRRCLRETAVATVHDHRGMRSWGGEFQ